MNGLERALLGVCALLVPLSSLRIGGVNLTAFDAAVAGLLGVQLVRSRGVPRLAPFFLAAGLIVGGALFSAVPAVEPIPALGQALQWAFIGLVAVPALYTAAAHPRSLPVIVAGVMAAAAVLGLHSVWEIRTGRAQFMGGRYVGLLGDPQVTAFTVTSLLGYLVIAPGAFPAARGRRLVAGAALALLGLMAWVLMLAASRTGMLAGVLVVVTIVGVLQLSRARTPGEVLSRLAGGSFVRLAAAGGLALAVVLAAPPDTLELIQRRAAAVLSGEGGPVEGRSRVYVEAAGMLDAGTLLHGVGLENYPLHSDYRQRPHNLVLLSLVEGGVVFLAGITLAIALFFVEAARGIRRWWSLAPHARPLAAAAGAGFLAFLAIAMLNTQSIARVYWFNYAIALGALTTLAPARDR